MDAPKLQLHAKAGKLQRLIGSFRPQRVGVFAWGMLGDSVCRLPLIYGIKRAFPEAHVTVMAQKPFQDVFSGAPYIDELVVCDVDSLKNHCMQDLKFMMWLRRQKFDAVFDPWGRKRTARYTMLSGAQIKAGVDLWNNRQSYYNVRMEIGSGSHGESVHLIHHGLFLLRAVGSAVDPRYQPIPIGDEDRQFAQETLKSSNPEGKRIVVFNVGTDGTEKTWPLERYAALVDPLLSRGDCVITALRNPDCPEKQEKLVEMVGQKVVPLPQMSIKQLAAFAELTDLLVTGDTGPLHIWQAMYRPCAVAVGVTHPSIFDMDSKIVSEVFHPDVCTPKENCNWRGCTRDRAYCIESVQVEEMAVICNRLLDTPIPEQQVVY